MEDHENENHYNNEPLIFGSLLADADYYFKNNPFNDTLSPTTTTPYPANAFGVEVQQQPMCWQISDFIQSDIYDTLGTILMGCSTAANCLLIATIMLWAGTTDSQNNSQSRTQFLLIGFLSVSDLVTVLTNAWFPSASRVTLNGLQCRLLPMIQNCTIFMSNAAMTAIAVDRYRKIVQRSERLISDGTLIWITVLAGTFSIAISILPAIHYRYDNIDKVLCDPLCYIKWPNKSLSNTYALVAFSTQYVIPLALISFCYKRVYTNVTKHVRKRHIRYANSQAATSVIYQNRKPQVNNSPSSSVQRTPMIHNHRNNQKADRTSSYKTLKYLPFLQITLPIEVLKRIIGIKPYPAKIPEHLSRRTSSPHKILKLRTYSNSNSNTKNTNNALLSSLPKLRHHNSFGTAKSEPCLVDYVKNSGTPKQSTNLNSLLSYEHSRSITSVSACQRTFSRQRSTQSNITTITRSEQNKREIKRLRTSINVFVLMVTLFAVCRLPMVILNLADEFGLIKALEDTTKNNTVYVASTIAHLFTLLPNLTNPVLYGLFNHSLRPLVLSKFGRCLNRLQECIHIYKPSKVKSNTPSQILSEYQLNSCDDIDSNDVVIML